MKKFIGIGAVILICMALGLTLSKEIDGISTLIVK